MAETIGSLVDKLSILELKIFYMDRQVNREDATQEHRDACKHKLEVMLVQRQDLGQEITELAKDVISGKKRLKVYRQFKMYNDPVYRSKSPL